MFRFLVDLKPKPWAKTLTESNIGHPRRDPSDAFLHICMRKYGTTLLSNMPKYPCGPVPRSRCISHGREQRQSSTIESLKVRQCVPTPPEGGEGWRRSYIDGDCCALDTTPATPTKLTPHRHSEHSEHSRHGRTRPTCQGAAQGGRAPLVPVLREHCIPHL